MENFENESDKEIGDYDVIVDDEIEVGIEDEIGCDTGDTIVFGVDTENLTPSVGMEFDNEVEAQNFYKSYASRKGFGIKVQTSTKSKQGISSVRFACSKEGFSNRQKQEQMIQQDASAMQRTPEKERSTTRCGCKAYMRVRRMPIGNWQVSVFNDEHNHSFLVSPSKKRSLRILKGISLEEKEIIASLRAQNMSVSQIWNFLAERAGGVNKLTFTKRDVCNEIVGINKKFLGIDVETTLIYFRKKQEEDPDFFYAIEPDENGAVKNLIWVDGRGRRAYKEFGDVVTFDTTYNTNKYCMPLGAFIGINHHWHSIFFGCCLLRNENVPNFVWLFTTWLRAMHNIPPRAIITDQDPAMKDAIKEVFGSNTIHRYCQWHVMRKARENLLSLYASKEGFEKELKAIINRSLTVLDFEEKWKNMVDTYKLHNVKHLKVMYDKRSKWVPCYFRHTFFANMSTTQRSESANFVLKVWVNNHTSIYNFVMQFEKVVEGIWQKESEEDCRTMNETPQLWSESRIEVEAREVYTRILFSKFKKSLKGSFNGVVFEIEKNMLYEVSITYHPTIENWIPETYRVVVSMSSCSFSCSCQGFEFQGMLCSHALRVMQHVGIQNLPTQYILKRWTRDANANSKRTGVHVEKDGDLETSKYAKLYPKLVEVGKLVSKSKSSDIYRLFETTLDEFKEKALVIMEQEESAHVPEESSQGIVPSNSTIEYHDPPLSQCKGRRKRPQRFKPPIEKNIKKMRTCSYCKQKKGHNLRTCPMRAKNADHEEKEVEEDDDEEEEDDDEEEEEEKALE